MKGFIRSLQNHYAGKPDVVRQIQKIYNGVEEEEKKREESGKEGDLVGMCWKACC